MINYYCWPMQEHLEVHLLVRADMYDVACRARAKLLSRHSTEQLLKT